ncbi:MAG: hypothetical protein COU51_05105 [Parcubacteria group bacterium CG10_big_fil_rev_8_21_14_0_10_36_14]|nr:MAG: hypothetical protein COU51_05105 [Parcubacteria group bacterium CG10_big_fil_rev_8_21_14_0_10_36_14]
MKVYKTKSSKYSGTKYSEVYKPAFVYYKTIKRKSKRKSYIKSAYFKKDKIFLELFWKRIWDNNNLSDKTRRLKYFKCGVELIENSKFEPISKQNVNRSNEILHRFAGTTKQNDLFYVHIKEDKKTDEKWSMSIFPIEDK